jgi:hypothetical protein
MISRIKWEVVRGKGCRVNKREGKKECKGHERYEKSG